jgi:hypothetical protein
MISYELAKQMFSYDPENGLIIRLGGPRPGPRTRANDRGYIQLKINNKTVRAHQLAWLLHYGEWPGQSIDHVNGIKADNRICNLRLATQALNCQNVVKPRKNNKSGYLGVHFSKVMNKYEASLRHNRKTIHLGYSDDPAQAHQIYLEAKRRIHEFCSL